MKQLEFSVVTYIEATMKELDITTTVLIDTGSEVTFFLNFLYPNGRKILSDKRTKLKEFILYLLT